MTRRPWRLSRISTVVTLADDVSHLTKPVPEPKAAVAAVVVATAAVVVVVATAAVAAAEAVVAAVVAMAEAAATAVVTDYHSPDSKSFSAGLSRFSPSSTLDG